MYHNSICCNSVRPLRFQNNGEIQITRPIQENKLDAVSLYGSLHGLSFDPSNTHALLRAVNSLQSIKESQRCSAQTSCRESPHQSSSNSSSTSSPENTTDSIPTCNEPESCPNHRSGQAPAVADAGPTQTQSSSGPTSQGSSGSTSQSLENSSERGSRQIPISKGSEPAQVSVGTASKGSGKAGVTWIDWGWPGTHDNCPFNPRHSVDDSLIRHERIFCESSNGILRTCCPCIRKLVKCCKLRVRQLKSAMSVCH
ncbi:uncharacterized protein [Physcomitrium patens]|uniref:uncharacterized protein isoform X1 n=1 Tax=Physcomitrium patens TaxID=3218 RepID=UPI000D16D8DF|nr:uncharacterized protein LOC112277690 [Physcomitrium patens]|eukprot:XP_024366077.1 uncharacterized protein LOC112277690 [Physcomitrella patens]